MRNQPQLSPTHPLSRHKRKLLRKTRWPNMVITWVLLGEKFTHINTLCLRAGCESRPGQCLATFSLLLLSGTHLSTHTHKHTCKHSGISRNMHMNMASSHVCLSGCLFIGVMAGFRKDLTVFVMHNFTQLTEEKAGEGEIVNARVGRRRV